MLSLPNEMTLSIIEYLTLYQTYNLRICCKQLFILLEKNASIWKKIITRDFNFPLDQLSIYKNNYIPFIFILDTQHQMFSGDEYVSKRFLKEKFFLSDNDIHQLSFIKIQKRRNNESNRYAYHLKDVIKLVCEKHQGITNFHLYSKKMTRIKNELILMRKRRQQELKKQFYIWRINEDKKSLLFLSLSCEKRKEILHKTLYNLGMIIKNDSFLCKSFINGNCTKSLDEIQALTRMAHYLHSYKMFNLKHETFKFSMEKIMFKNRANKNFEWMDAFLAVKKKYDKTFLFI